MRCFPARRAAERGPKHRGSTTVACFCPAQPSTGNADTPAAEAQGTPARRREGILAAASRHSPTVGPGTVALPPVFGPLRGLIPLGRARCARAVVRGGNGAHADRHVAPRRPMPDTSRRRVNHRACGVENAEGSEQPALIRGRLAALAARGRGRCGCRASPERQFAIVKFDLARGAGGCRRARGQHPIAPVHNRIAPPQRRAISQRLAQPVLRLDPPAALGKARRHRRIKPRAKR